MDPKRNIRAWSLVAVGGAVAMGCGASGPSPELVDARASYAHAQAGAAPQRAPAALHDAEVALTQAERAHVDEVTEPNPRTLAYVAERKADLADIAGCESMEHDRWSQAQQVSQRLTTQAGMQAAPTATPPAAGSRTSTLVARVLFGTGKSALTPGAQAQLNEFVSAMHDEPDTKAVIAGHADSTGSADRNERLSEMRADAVKTFLVGHGVSPDRIETKGFGEAEPAASNDTTQGRANNRRVDVMLEIKTLPQTH